MGQGGIAAPATLELHARSKYLYQHACLARRANPQGGRSLFKFVSAREHNVADVSRRIEQSFALANEVYAELGVDADAALKRLSGITISLHCWQGDDVTGFESTGSALGGGLVATGNYLGRARTPQELRTDFGKSNIAHPRPSSHQSACLVCRSC